MLGPEPTSSTRRRIQRLARSLLIVALLALVVVPSAAAIRFTDDSFQVADGAVGSRYYHQFKGDGGCGPALPYRFRILNGSLPPGLTLAPNGLVSGVPTQGGNWSFWVELSDQDPPTADWCIPRKSEREFIIDVGLKGSVPDAVPPAGSAGGGGACNLPVVATVCDAVGGAVGRAATEVGEFVMRGVTAWVTNAAVWITGKVGELVERSSTPDLRASWFEAQYGTMVAVAGALALLMLMLAVIQSVIRQDVWLLARAAFGYLPMAFILAGVAIAGAGLLIAITDDMSGVVVSSLGTNESDNLLQAVGEAYERALEEGSGIPLFGVFLGAIILAIGAFVLWLEMIIRDAAIYICVFFLPLTFVAMIWPATGRWARRLVELLVAVILAKFLIVSILTLATAAITNTGVVDGDGSTFEQMLAGSALLVLAAWSPFALLRMIPAMEMAAANVASQRSTVQNAAGSAGVHSPAEYMRKAMNRQSRSSASSGTRGEIGTAYVGGPSGRSSTSPGGEPAGGDYEQGRAGSRPGHVPATTSSQRSSAGAGGERSVETGEAGHAPPASAGGTRTQRSPAPGATPQPRPSEPSPPPPTQGRRSPDLPPDRTPPPDRHPRPDRRPPPDRGDA